MRTYSFFAIVLLCLALLAVDALSYYWLTSITNLIPSLFVKKLISIAFWLFSVGLILAILILKLRLAYIAPQRKQLLISSLYGLTISSFIPKLVFVIIISVLYFTNYVFSEEESMIFVPIAGLLSGVLPFGVIMYGIFWTLYRFKVRHHEISFPELPKNFDRLRIVHISDAHLGSFNARYPIFERAVTLINQLEPDYIFFTGDLVNNFAWELRGWEGVFDKLSAKYGKYSVLGNHDYGNYSEWESTEDKQENFEAIKNFQKEIGFQLLLNQAEIIEREGQKIVVVGVEDWGDSPAKRYGNLQKALTHVHDIPFKVLLSHNPAHWSQEVLKQTNIALTLSGHTHGMQAGIHLGNKKWSPIKYKYRQWAGLYQENGQYLYVNRGLGWLGFPGRLGMRPEITCIVLKSDSVQSA